MIYTERVISVKGGTASIDAPIVLYRGDRNIEIVFEIVNNKFKFSEKGNYILDIGAKYGQLAVDMPDGTDLFTDIAECLDGKVIFKITGDMINEIAENGFYSFHVRLFNDDKTSRVTIPPVMEGIEIREPIVIEGDAIFPIVDMGGADIAPIDSDEETFIDENGKLDIQWKTGDMISSTRLNQMVGYINENTYSRDEFDLSSYVNKEYLDTKIEYMDREMDEYDAELANTNSLLESIKDDVNEIRGDYASEQYVDFEVKNIVDKLDVTNANIQSIQATLENTNSKFNEYATIDYVDSKESSMIDQMNDMHNEISNNSDRLSDHDAAIVSIQHDISGDNGIEQQLTEHHVEIETIKEGLAEIQDKIANGSDGSGHATEVYVDNLVNTLREDTNGMYETCMASIDESKEEIKQECNTYTDEVRDNITNIFGNYYETTAIDERFDSQNEVLNAHATRIETLETAVEGIPDVSGFATIEYVDNQNVSQNETINETINGHNTRIEALETAVEGIPDVSGFATIEYVDGKNNSIRDTLFDHASMIGTNKNVISQLETRVAVLEDSEGESNDNSEAVTVLQTQVSQHDTRINALEEAVENLPESPDLSPYATTEYVNTQNNSQNETISNHATRITTLEEAVENLPDNIDLSPYATTEYVNTQNNSQNETIRDHATRIKTLEETVENLPESSESPDLTKYATKSYVDMKHTDQGYQINSMSDVLAGHMGDYSDFKTDVYERITSTNDRIDMIGDYSGAGVPNLTDYATKAYVNREISDTKNYVDEQLIDPRETIRDHATRIKTLEETVENLPESSESPDLSNYVNNMQFSLMVSRVESLENTVGNINDILDAINGEEI